MGSDEKRIEHTQPEAGKHAQAGQPITTPEDNDKHERQQKFNMARSFRLTTEKNNSFTLDMGDGKHVKDSRPVSNQEILSPLGSDNFRKPEESSLLSNQSNQPDLPYQPDQPDQPAQLLSIENVRALVDQLQHPNEQPSQLLAAEEFAKVLGSLSISVDIDGKMAVKENVDNRTDVVGGHLQVQMIGGESYNELQNGMQFMHQEDSTNPVGNSQIAETVSAVLMGLHSAEKVPVQKDNSDSTTAAKNNSKRLSYVRPEQYGRRLAEEILTGNFPAFNHDRNVEKFHFTPEQLKTLQETFQQVMAEQQFNAVHGLDCTPEEATQKLHNIGKAVEDGLINAEEAKSIKKRYELLEINMSHIANDE